MHSWSRITVFYRQSLVALLLSVLFGISQPIGAHALGANVDVNGLNGFQHSNAQMQC